MRRSPPGAPWRKVMAPEERAEFAELDRKIDDLRGKAAALSKQRALLQNRYQQRMFERVTRGAPLKAQGGRWPKAKPKKAPSRRAP